MIFFLPDILGIFGHMILICMVVLISSSTECDDSQRHKKNMWKLALRRFYDKSRLLADCFSSISRQWGWSAEVADTMDGVREAIKSGVKTGHH